MTTPRNEAAERLRQFVKSYSEPLDTYDWLDDLDAALAHERQPFEYLRKALLDQHDHSASFIEQAFLDALSIEQDR